jgi:hypothetical protein
VALVGQARRYGLGLVFATSTPKGLHAVPGSAATQFVGLLDGSAEITAVQAMMAARGGQAHEVGALADGVFYAATEGQPFEKVAAPMCLTYHPSAPLTTHEIVARANTYPGA